jgi:hypothetical protein
MSRNCRKLVPRFANHRTSSGVTLTSEPPTSLIVIDRPPGDGRDGFAFVTGRAAGGGGGEPARRRIPAS